MAVPLGQQRTDKHEDKPTPIGALTPGMQSVNCTFIVVEKATNSYRAPSGDFVQMRVADATGSVSLNVSSEQFGGLIEEGDILRLRSGHTNVFKGTMTLNCGRNGELVKVGEYTMVFSETPNKSEYTPEYAEKFPPPQKKVMEMVPGGGGDEGVPRPGGPPRSMGGGGGGVGGGINRDPRTKRPLDSKPSSGSQMRDNLY